jgi:hypothetical protein
MDIENLIYRVINGEKVSSVVDEVTVSGNIAGYPQPMAYVQNGSPEILRRRKKRKDGKDDPITYQDKVLMQDVGPASSG